MQSCRICQNYSVEIEAVELEIVESESEIGDLAQRDRPAVVRADAMASTCRNRKSVLAGTAMEELEGVAAQDQYWVWKELEDRERQSREVLPHSSRDSVLALPIHNSDIVACSGAHPQPGY